MRKDASELWIDVLIDSICDRSTTTSTRPTENGDEVHLAKWQADRAT
jgi:hypothetical protein